MKVKFWMNFPLGVKTRARECPVLSLSCFRSFPELHMNTKPPVISVWVWLPAWFKSWFVFAWARGKLPTNPNGARNVLNQAASCWGVFLNARHENNPSRPHDVRCERQVLVAGPEPERRRSSAGTFGVISFYEVVGWQLYCCWLVYLVRPQGDNVSWTQTLRSERGKRGSHTLSCSLDCLLTDFQIHF